LGNKLPVASQAAFLSEKSSPSLRKDSSDSGLGATGDKKKNKRKISNWFVKVSVVLNWFEKAIVVSYWLAKISLAFYRVLMLKYGVWLTARRTLQTVRFGLKREGKKRKEVECTCEYNP
jgi:hypothetical protein